MVGARGVAGRPTSADRLACGEAEVARRRALRVAFGNWLWVPVGTSPRALGPILGFPNHPLVSVSSVAQICSRFPPAGGSRRGLLGLGAESPETQPPLAEGRPLSDLLRAREIP